MSKKGSAIKFHLSRIRPITSGLVIILVALVLCVYFWQHSKVNGDNQNISTLKKTNSNLQKQNGSLSKQLAQAISKETQLGRVYRIGDTQNGITLIGMYHNSYQDMMAGNGSTPPTVNTVVFALSGVSTSDAFSSITLTTDGNYLSPDSRQAPIAACGTNACVGFDVSDSNTNSPKYTATTFFYKNLQWQL